jgi:DNA-binding transcriptional MerR regulator
MYKIGDFSIKVNVPVKTLRYYDEIDLFKPNFVNKENKYRYYTLDQFQHLETIKYLKNLGFNDIDIFKYMVIK